MTPYMRDGRLITPATCSPTPDDDPEAFEEIWDEEPEAPTRSFSNGKVRYTLDRQTARAARLLGLRVRLCEGLGDDGSDLPGWVIG